MSKPNRKRIRLSEIRNRLAAAATVTHLDLEFEATDGAEHVVSFLAQDLWPVEVVEEVQARGDNASISILREIATPADEFQLLVSDARLTVGELKEILKDLQEEASTTAGEGTGS